MNSATVKKYLGRTVVFLGTTALSIAIMNALPRIRQQRQRSFAQAASEGNLRRMRWLHFAGARVNVRGNCCMPLYLAAADGNLKAVRYLLDEGADLNAREKFGNTALAEAVYYGHLEVVRELLRRGADPNSIGDDGTPLDIADARNHQAIAELLKHNGARTAVEIRTGG